MLANTSVASNGRFEHNRVQQRTVRRAFALPYLACPPNANPPLAGLPF